MAARKGHAVARYSLKLAKRIAEMRQRCMTWEQIAAVIGCDRRTLENWRNKYPAFAQLCEDANDGRLGTLTALAESASARHLRDVAEGNVDRLNANLALGLLRQKHPSLREAKQETENVTDPQLVADIVDAMRQQRNAE